MKTRLYLIGALASGLVRIARAAGVVLTVEQRSHQPPAMGHYGTVVLVRPARSRAP